MKMDKASFPCLLYVVVFILGLLPATSRAENWPVLRTYDQAC